MGISRFMTDRFISSYGDVRHRRLVLVVEIIDNFTGRHPTIPLKVSLQGPVYLYPLRSREGLFCFEQFVHPGNVKNHFDGEYIINIQSQFAATELFYLQTTNQEGIMWKESLNCKITLPMQDPQAPVEHIYLSPKTAYPFPANTTLLRGKVIYNGSNTRQGAVNALISCIYSQVDPEDIDSTVDQQIETLSDNNGEYVLYFKNLPRKKQQVVITVSTSSESKRIPAEIVENATTKARVVHIS